MTQQAIPIPASDEAANEGSLEGTRPTVKLGRTIIWVLVAGLLVFLAMGLLQAFQTQPQSGEAPDFTLTLYGSDETITLSELRGQVVVVNFWASWCGPCAQEAPALEAAWQTYQDQGVMFIGVGYVDSDAKAQAFIRKYGITYPNGPDLGTEISDAYAIRGVPETFIINESGEVVYFAMQPLTFDRLAGEIEAALAGAAQQ